MRTLECRLGALELAADPPRFEPWKLVFQYVGQTEGEAVAAWEAENGPLLDRPHFFVSFK